ncbi:general odorant-binding protein 69a [Uranotaenia lowii]|uniref:general odorant-binding protein 69a n=1 Tax=Uranotaenia lowii TaxID=190385 RepID=UPI002478B1A4|nr:general odorant-binding protein 69a [Uranotaenia lowii]
MDSPPSKQQQQPGKLSVNFPGGKVSPLLLLLAFLLLQIAHVDRGALAAGEIEVPDYVRRPAKILHNICLAESGASEELLMQCMDGSLHQDRAVKCYIYCLFDKIDVIDEATNRIMLDRLAPLSPDADIKNLLHQLTTSCGHMKLEDSCDAAFEVAKCYFSAHDQVVRFCHILMADITN